MEFSNVIETIGSITRMENLQPLEQDVIDHSLVLRNIDPFPGCHNDNKPIGLRKKQESIFIVLRFQYASEKINIIFKNFANARIIKCSPNYGEIFSSGTISACIRLKGIENYAFIPFVQEYFLKNDLQLMDYKRIDTLATIKIFKSFRIIRIAEGLYRDANEAEKVYIRIPKALNWKQFTSLTKKVKYNLEDPNFDAALGTIYRFYGTEDVIRIYDNEATIEKAKLLKLMYNKEIKSNRLISARHLHYE